MLPSGRCAMGELGGGGGDLEGERRRLAHAARQVAARGLVVGTAGNLSARAGELVAITPTGVPLDQLSPEQIVAVDLAGVVVDGHGSPSSEHSLHLGVYERYGAGAVVHAHAPMATALGCLLDELPVVHYQMLELGGAVRVAPYATFGTAELAAVTLDALEGRTAALMANHGAIVYAGDIDAAVERMLLLEWACSVYWHAAALGSPRTLDERQLAAVGSEIVRRGGYGALRGEER